METPEFWKHRSLLTRCLQPMAWLYACGYLVRRAFTVQVKLPVPVVCIGNITMGGSGKTPLALHLGQALRERGVNAYYVSRGYGGVLEGPVQVHPEKHRSYHVGDEPLLLAEILPTVVGKDRLAAAQFAIQQGAQMLIFDDGFQNKKIFKDFSFLVLDGLVRLGNGYLFPAGPLRESLARGLRRAHCVVVIHPTQAAWPIPGDRPVLYAHRKVVGLAERLRGQKVVAFCGIAFPEKFQETLTSLGTRLIHFQAFGDHAHYRHDSLLPLAEIASKERAYLVTTRKDFVRLPKGFKDKVVIVDIALEFTDPAALHAQIDAIARLP